MSNHEQWDKLARKVVRTSGLTNARIARDAGLSRATLHAWIAGTRVPQRESLLRLAAGLERRAARLTQLAAHLRSVASGQDRERA